MDINERKKTSPGEKVFYYFKPVGVDWGHYQRQELDAKVFGQKGIMVDVFFDNNGKWLVEDVTHWMPRNDGDVFPKKPEEAE